MIHTMVQDPKPDRTYFAYLSVVVALTMITLFNYLILVPRLDLTLFKIDHAAARDYVVDGTSPYHELNLLSQRSDVNLNPGELISVYHKPFFRTILSFPLAAIPDTNLAEALQLTLIEISIAITLALAAKLLFRQAPNLQSLAILIPILALPGFMSGIRLGDETLIILALITLSVWSIQKGQDEVGGVTLALGFTSFESFGIAFITIFLWLIYKGRARFLMGFGLTLAFLLLMAHIFDPNWYIGYLKSQYIYYQQNQAFKLTAIFTESMPGAGFTLAKVTAVLFLASILYEWHTIAKREFNAFLWVLALSFTIPTLLGIGTAIQWSVANVIGIVLVIIRFSERWKTKGYLIAISTFSLAEIGIRFLVVPVSVGLALFVMPLIITILLYWVRWDSVRTTRLWADILEDQGKI